MIKVFVKDCDGSGSVVETKVFRSRKKADAYVIMRKHDGYPCETQLMLFDEEIRIKAKGAIDKQMLRAYNRAIKQLLTMVGKLQKEREKIEANIKRN